MQDYRRIWENAYGPIPIDDEGRPYEIHHIDGNRDNNELSNLTCLSVTKHYQIHYKQGDKMACLAMSKRMNLPYDVMLQLHKEAMLMRDQWGSKNPMFGRSAILEQDLKWYNNGRQEKMITEGEEPDGWKRGRLKKRIKAMQYDKFGANNPTAKPVKVILRSGHWKNYPCLKDVQKEFPQIPYGSLKGNAQRNKYKEWYSDKWAMRIIYV